MFIDFAGMMINTNYIISVYKTESITYKEMGKNNLYIINMKIYSNSSIIKKLYNTPEERDKAFDKLINELNNK